MWLSIIRYADQLKPRGERVVMRTPRKPMRSSVGGRNYGAEALKEARKLILSIRRCVRQERVTARIVTRGWRDRVASLFQPGGGASAPMEATPWSALYLVIGLCGVHMLHVSRFMLVGWDRISAFPDWQIELHVALWLGLMLIPIGITAILVLRRWPRVFVAVAMVVLCESISQVLGRSMFKLVGDLGVWGTILAGYSLQSHYGVRTVHALPAQQLAAFHSECLGLMRTAVNVCLFVIGTLGIAVTSNLISQYFEGPLGQGTAWVHVGTMLYLAIGMACFVVQPLHRGAVAARRQLSAAS